MFGRVMGLFFVSCSIEANSPADFKKIEAYVQEGEYSKALQEARNQYGTARQRDDKSLEIAWSDKVTEMEKLLLEKGASNRLIDADGKPRVKLIQVLKLAGLPDGDKTLLQIHTWAQKTLLRKGEIWDQQTVQFETLKARVKPLLQELGFLDAPSAHFLNYDGALIHGATLPAVRLRFDYLVKEWQRGVRFDALVFLGGERALLATERDTLQKEGHSNLPKTEIEMMRLVWESAQIPEEMRSHFREGKNNLYFVSAPMNATARPTTEDTIRFWLQQAPKDGRYLCVSNAPYTIRQDISIRRLGKGHQFDTIGPNGKELQVALYLDEVARCLDQLKKQADEKAK
jgi:hypothetical protein